MVGLFYRKTGLFPCFQRARTRRISRMANYATEFIRSEGFSVRRKIGERWPNGERWGTPSEVGCWRQTHLLLGKRGSIFHLTVDTMYVEPYK